MALPNETLALLAARRSVPPHLLAEPAPEGAELDTLLTLGSRIPDHGKLAPWRFIVIRGEARRRIGEAIAAAFRADEPGADDKRIQIERDRLARAPLVIAVVSKAAPHVKIPVWEQVLSAGASLMTMTIAANAMGYGTAWLTEWFAYDRRVLDALGLAPEERIAGFLHVGTPAERQPDRPRPPLADIVTHLEG